MGFILVTAFFGTLLQFCSLSRCFTHRTPVLDLQARTPRPSTSVVRILSDSPRLSGETLNLGKNLQEMVFPSKGAVHYFSNMWWYLTKSLLLRKCSLISCLLDCQEPDFQVQLCSIPSPLPQRAGRWPMELSQGGSSQPKPYSCQWQFIFTPERLLTAQLMSSSRKFSSPSGANCFLRAVKMFRPISYIGWHSRSVLLEVCISKGSWGKRKSFKKPLRPSNVLKPKGSLHSTYSSNCFANRVLKLTNKK